MNCIDVSNFPVVDDCLAGKLKAGVSNCLTCHIGTIVSDCIKKHKVEYDGFMLRQTIGIIGGGQLGRMLTLAALPMGFKVIVLDPVEDSPAAQAGAMQIIKPYDDEAALTKLARQADYITTEFEEGLDVGVLTKLSASGAQINPHPKTVALILDKFEQKKYLSKNGVAMGPYAPIDRVEEAYKLLKQYGGKMLIKTRRGGYDGYGNRVVQSRADIDRALKAFQGKSVYAEAFVPFEKELAVMVVRGMNGDIKTYPVVETIQKNNICHEVLVPANISSVTRRQAQAMATKVAGLFAGAGAFGIEMFITKDGQVWLNEIAPRVHNSGHYTIEAVRTSQFEQHIRAITGLPLGDTRLVVPAAVMINILGERDGPAEVSGLDKALAIPHTNVHIYGKSATRPGRKMGHITATGKTLKQAQDRARKARKQLSI